MIADAPPATYVPGLEERFDKAALQSMYRDHALPYGWEQMGYEDFLRERRSLMAQTIKAAYERLAGHPQVAANPPAVSELVASGESAAVEFKSTLRTNLHTGDRDAKMELAVLKTIAGFLNKQGGTLVVGVADDGSPVGVEADGFANEDKMALHLINLLKERLGGQHALYVHPRFDGYQGVRALVISCDPAKSPAFEGWAGGRALLCPLWTVDTGARGRSSPGIHQAAVCGGCVSVA